jgi:hemolysin III
VTAPTRLRPVDLGKPRMRGWLHAYAAGAAVLCGAVLSSLAATRPGWAPFVSCLIYSLTVVALFTTSALYHRRVWTQSGYKIMKPILNAMKCVFIAG